MYSCVFDSRIGACRDSVSTHERNVAIAFWWASSRDSPRARDVVIDKATGRQVSIRLYDSSARVIYNQFKTAHPDIAQHVGFSTFKAVKPNYVRRMNPAHRSTCLCVYHANSTLAAKALARYKKLFIQVSQAAPDDRDSSEGEEPLVDQGTEVEIEQMGAARREQLFQQAGSLA